MLNSDFQTKAQMASHLLKTILLVLFHPNRLPVSDPGPWMTGGLGAPEPATAPPVGEDDVNGAGSAAGGLEAQWGGAQRTS